MPVDLTLILTIIGAGVIAPAVVSVLISTIMSRRYIRQQASRVGDAYDAGCADTRRQCGCPTCMTMVRLYEEHGSSTAVVAALQGNRHGR